MTAPFTLNQMGLLSNGYGKPPRPDWRFALIASILVTAIVCSGLLFR